jgi:hypothetical protein
MASEDEGTEASATNTMTNVNPHARRNPRASLNEARYVF